MDAVAAALAIGPPPDPLPDDAVRATVTLSDGSVISGTYLPTTRAENPQPDAICVVLGAGSVGPEAVSVWINPAFIASIMLDPSGEDAIIPAHLRIRRG